MVIERHESSFKKYPDEINLEDYFNKVFDKLQPDLKRQVNRLTHCLFPNAMRACDKKMGQNTIDDPLLRSKRIELYHKCVLPKTPFERSRSARMSNYEILRLLLMEYMENNMTANMSDLKFFLEGKNDDCLPFRDTSEIFISKGSRGGNLGVEFCRDLEIYTSKEIGRTMETIVNKLIIKRHKVPALQISSAEGSISGSTIDNPLLSALLCFTNEDEITLIAIPATIRKTGEKIRLMYVFPVTTRRKHKIGNAAFVTVDNVSTIPFDTAQKMLDQLEFRGLMRESPLHIADGQLEVDYTAQLRFGVKDDKERRQGYQVYARPGKPEKTIVNVS